jgi:general secretion pathway protein G
MQRRGFTLIELMVVMAIVALLLTLVTPRYFQQLDRARETALKETLSVTRTAIDQFHADHNRYPESLDELVDKRYLRQAPIDPITEQRDSWTLLTPPPTTEGAAPSGVWDLRSGATVEGKNYGEW